MKKQILIAAAVMSVLFAPVGALAHDLWSAGVSIGTTGISPSITYRESRALSTTAQVGGLSVDPSFSVGGEQYAVGVNLFSGLIAENWRPFPKTGLFLTAGLLFNFNKLSLQPQNTEGDYAFATPATATFHPVDPFFGIGWTQRLFDGPLSIQAELGAAYQGRATINVKMGSGPYAQMAYDQERSSLQSAMGFRWLPVAQVGLRMRF